MGTVTDLSARRATKQRDRDPDGNRFVVCEQCSERHPLIRLGDGSVRCVTAFTDGERWFCRSRGCRAAWLQPPPTD